MSTEKMSESQQPERCTKCDFDFLAISGIQFNFCPLCGCPRVKPTPASNSSPRATNGSVSPSVELAEHGGGVDSTEKNSIQSGHKEPGQLTTNENYVPKPDDDSKVISDHTTTRTHETDKVEETPLPMSEGITNSSAISSNNQVLIQDYYPRPIE